MASDAGEQLGPAPTSESAEGLGLQEEFARLEALVGDLFDHALKQDDWPPDAVSEAALAHSSIHRLADQGDFLAGFLRDRIEDCDGHLHDAEAELGGWNGRLRDARQLCWGIAEELPDGRKEGRGRVSRCARCLEININATPNTLPCPGCERRDRGDQA